MLEKILVITERDRSLENIFLIHKTNGTNYKKELLQHLGRKNNFSLCIIENKMLVKEYLELVKFVKRFFSMPICAFECNIVQNYPGEILILKDFIDIIIKRKLEIDDVYSLFGTMIYNNNDCEEKVELLTYSDKIVILPGKRIIAINDKKITLTRTEFDIFYYLFQKKGNVVSHKELYEQVWKSEYFYADTNIMAHIHRLRGKVEKDPKKPKYICNQYGVGYYFGGLYQEALPTL